MKSTALAASTLLGSLAFVPSALADIPAPSPKTPELYTWNDSPTFDTATMVILGVAVVVALVSVWAIGVLRDRARKR